MFVRKKRGSAARRRPKGKAKPKSRFPRPHLPEGLQQRHLDLIGLFLIAAGVYLCFVLFFGWDGGKVGYGLETGLEYLFGAVGARIATVLMLAVGTMLVTGTSVSTVFRGLGRGVHHTFSGGRDIAQTAIQHREDRRSERASAFDTKVGPTDVMSAYPEEDDEFEPTVAIAEAADEEPEPETVTHEFAELTEEAEPEVEPDDVPAAEQPQLTPMGNKRGVTESEQIDYRQPPANVLEKGKGDKGPDPRDHEVIGRKLVETLGHFGVEAKIVGTVAGPHITRYEVRLAPGVKMSKVANLKDDLAYALAATDIRILAPIPGKTAVGVEVPNERRRVVQLGDVYGEAPEDWSPLTVWLGKDVAGRGIGADLAKMPHLLVAGTTGAGKSACVNAMLSSILLNADPHEVRLVLVDPKQVE
ncbi:MAG TPA: DNA translocase FtsK, partial [Solirubrobacterales bacterium]|nr:DNA translocase FtsK [Solirubrobacterales bacterium]